MELIIKRFDGETTTISVDLDTTIGDLKRRIKEQFNVPTDKQKLSFVNGSSVTLSDDSKTVSQYGLSSRCVVMVLVMKIAAPVQVFLKNEKGQMKTFDVVLSETVLHFKGKVFNKEGVPVDQQRLICEGRQLADDHWKLEDYNVRPGSTIFLTLRLRGG